MPWRPRTPQERGGAVERSIARREGLREHPRSGAGRVKLDASDAERLVEIKSANQHITLHGARLRQDAIRAHRLGKELSWLIQFGEANCEVEVTVRLT